MATAERPAPSEFERRRAALVGEIGDSLEQVLTQINGLNRSLEGIIEIGNEFASVEALWSQFENVMARETDPESTVTNQDEQQSHSQQTTPAQEGGVKSEERSSAGR